MRGQLKLRFVSQPINPFADPLVNPNWGQSANLFADQLVHHQEGHLHPEASDHLVAEDLPLAGHRPEEVHHLLRDPLEAVLQILDSLEMPI
jgi:hypothetical protein